MKIDHAAGSRMRGRVRAFPVVIGAVMKYLHSVRLRLSARAAALGVLAGMASAPALAQSPANFPEKPVKIVVPYTAGGAVDINARALASELGKLWGQGVVVENKAGGAGVLGGSYVANAAPDGYTLFLADDGVLVSMPLFQEKMPYDTLKDLMPVAMVGMFPYMFFASANLKAKSMQEVVALAKAKPGSIDYATNGIGGTHHLLWERLQRSAGIKLNHIPYKSASPALQDVLAGRVPLMLVGVSTAYSHINDGKLVPLAIGSLERSSLLPNVPTMAESGFPKFEAIAWTGVLAPKGTPAALVEKISADIAKVTRGKPYGDALQQRGSEPRTSTPREMGERMVAETDNNRELLKTLNIKRE
jgi:tripartite-type tricarboxylate transporter receptor subunit TctC